MNKIVIGIIFGVGLALLIGGSVFIGIFPRILKNKIKEEVPLAKNSDAYERWIGKVNEGKPEVVMQYHFFELNNTDYESLDDIELIERTYIYDEIRFKQNITKIGDDLLQYRENRSFTFRINQVNDENNETHFINIPILAMLQNQLKGLDSAMVRTFNKIYHGERPANGETDLFIKRKPADILFNGVPYDIFKDISKSFGAFGIKAAYSIYDGKKVLEPEWTVNTGEKDINKIGQLHSFDNKPDLRNIESLRLLGDFTIPIWKLNYTGNNNCSQLKGTQGFFVAPDVSKDDTLWIYEPQLCRPVPLKFWKESEVRGIDTYRFKLADSFYNSSAEDEDNSCYCVGDFKFEELKNQTKCKRKGLLDISHCFRRSFGAPIVTSYPYFKYTDGLEKQFKYELKSPQKFNDDNYGTYLDIEPMTGMTLRVKRRMQINIEILKKNYTTMPQLGNSKKDSYVVPLLWLDESGEATEMQADFFKSMIINKKKLVTGVSITIIVVGAIISIVSVYLFIRNR